MTKASFLLFNQAFASFTGTAALLCYKRGGSKVSWGGAGAVGAGLALVGGAVPEAFSCILFVSCMDILLNNNIEITDPQNPNYDVMKSHKS